jgi:SAM-dependent methyltransferase
MTSQKAAVAVDMYGATYRNFASELYAEIRAEAFGEDIGQTGWLTAEEQDMFIAWLGLSAQSRLLDIACGSGEPGLRIAKKTDCSLTGIDINAAGIAAAKQNAAARGLSGRAEFVAGNVAERLPFPDETFDALICIDAINHLPDRPRVLAEWRRVLRPGGKLLFTDPIVLTGPITTDEIAVRASIGLFVFAPPGTDEALLTAAGFTVERIEDRTANMAANAAGWLEARATREAGLCIIEGNAVFDGQQKFLATAAKLAKERRLSRFAVLASC